MANKQFADRLNKELDNIGVPLLNNERVEVFAKLLKVPKFKAEAFLNGAAIPDSNLLAILADELEVSADWLLGKSEQKKS
ncbi:Uncharacterised protein [Legionella beliardensis]|uniref:HTH cro/C1-type domain-containing protein n=1 Tax=Legionella beliardensis TaxID=91822 RepID=A0A378I6P1_9GAMM|nr:hypothetical protein [Legionella beliardensis]STX28124.1 Uncharacterised protein [Legionella beliardensis]